MTQITNIAVFAHNEENEIERCLTSIVNATRNPKGLNVSVLINGSTDGTEQKVKQFCEKHVNFHYRTIRLGDKSNAWNSYVYGEIDIQSRHFFLDGDNWLPALSLDAINDLWDDDKHWGLAALPIGVSEVLRETMLKNHWISGNFYGLSSRFIKTVRSSRFKLPVGYIGDDSLVSYLLECGFKGSAFEQSVFVIEHTGPVIPRVGLSLLNIKMLHNRYKRYAIRHFQQEVFYYLAKNGRLDELPAHASGIKSHLLKIGLRPFIRILGIENIYYPYAILHILFSRVPEEISDS